MLRGRRPDRLTQGNRLQVISAANFRLAAVFHSAKELCHRPDKGVGEPYLLPARLKPVAWLALRREIERAWCPGRIARPANGAAGQAVGPLDAPTDVDVTLGAFAGRPRPGVVPGTRAAAAV